MMHWMTLVLEGIVYVAGAVIATMVAILAYFVGRRNSADKPAVEDSIMLAHLKKQGIADTQENLDAMIATIAQVGNDDSNQEELQELHRLNANLQRQNDKLRGDLTKAEQEPQSQVALLPGHQTGFAPDVLSNPYDMINAIRDGAREELSRCINDALDAGSNDVARITNLTDLIQALDEEQNFVTRSGVQELKDAFEESWIHALFRAQALFNTYRPDGSERFTAHLSSLCFSINTIAQNNGFSIAPIRLLVPTQEQFNGSDDTASELMQILSIRNTLRSLANGISLEAQDFPAMMIDCEVATIAGPDGFLMTPRATVFRVRDWQTLGGQ